MCHVLESVHHPDGKHTLVSSGRQLHSCNDLAPDAAHAVREKDAVSHECQFARRDIQLYRDDVAFAEWDAHLGARARSLMDT